MDAEVQEVSAHLQTLVKHLPVRTLILMAASGNPGACVPTWHQISPPVPRR